MSPNVTEIYEKMPDGEEIVKYRRSYESEGAKELIEEVEHLQSTSPNTTYRYRHVYISDWDVKW